METFILGFMQNNPTLASVLVIIGAVRVVVKPAMAYYEAHVASTPDKVDDEKLVKVKSAAWYKALVFILDYAASVKLPK